MADEKVAGVKVARRKGGDGKVVGRKGGVTDRWWDGYKGT
jgi:hypothetical protein